MSAKPVLEDCEDPWGEKYVASLQALRPRDAVRDHIAGLAISSRLTRWWRAQWQPAMIEVTPENVIAALNRVGIRPVLMGAHAISGFRSESRSTGDVDVLVTKREVGKAVRTLENEFPYLTTKDQVVVVRFLVQSTEQVVLDVMRPAHAALQIAFRNSIAIGETHRIPTLEMALVAKFAAMTSPNRKRAKKMIDAGDFIDIVQHNRQILNVKKLVALAERVYTGAGAEIAEMVEDIDADRAIKI